MNMPTKIETVYFSIKGQVVIPRRLRQEFEIEEGTRAYVQSTPQGILIQPLTATRRVRAGPSSPAPAALRGLPTHSKATRHAGPPVSRMQASGHRGKSPA